MDGLRHRPSAKATGNSYSPYLRPPRQSSTLPPLDRACSFQATARAWSRIAAARSKGRDASTSTIGRTVGPGGGDARAFRWRSSADAWVTRAPVCVDSPGFSTAPSDCPVANGSASMASSAWVGRQPPERHVARFVVAPTGNRSRAGVPDDVA
jgi:hypothetical protein